MPDVNLQGLQFEIKADASSASKSIDDLSASLTKLDDAQKFSTEDSGVKKLAEILDKLPTEKTKGFVEIAKGFKDIKVSPKLAENTEKFVKALDSLTVGTISDWKSLREILDGFPRLPAQRTSSSSSSRVPQVTEKTDDIPKVAESTQNPLEGSASDELEKTAQAAVDAKKAVSDAFNDIAAKSIDGAVHVSAVTDEFGRLRQTAVIPTMPTMDFEGVFAPLIMRLQELPSLSQIAANSLTKLGSAAKSALKNLVGLPLLIGKRLATSVKQTTSGLGTFLSSLKRIAFYRLIRTALKAITQGFAEGQKNLYQYSKLMGTQFYQSMDRLASASLYLKNSLAAMAAPLINAVTPAIEFVIDKLVQLFNWVNKLLSALTGKSVTTVAKKVTKDFDDAAGRAGGSARKAADELKRTILAFDELNVLNDNNKHGSNGGGGTNSDAEDYGSMFEEVEVESYFSDLADRIKDAFMSSDWESLGRILGAEVNKLFDNLDFAGAGEKVGGAINAVIKSAYYFLDEVNFENIGKKLMSFLNNMVDKIEWRYVGGLPVKFATSILDLIIGAVKEFDPKTFATAFTDYVSGAFDTLTDWVKSKDWKQLGVDLETKIVGFIVGVDWVKVLKSVIIGVFEVLKGLLQFADGLLGAFFKDLFSGLGTLLVNLLKPVFQGLWLNLFTVTGLIKTDWGKEAFAWGYSLIDKMGEGMESNSLEGTLDKALEDAKAGLDTTIPVTPIVDKKGMSAYAKNLYKDSKKNPATVLTVLEDNTRKQYEGYRKNIRTLTQKDPLQFNSNIATTSKDLFDQFDADWKRYTTNRTLPVSTRVNDNSKEMYRDTATYYGRVASAAGGLPVDVRVRDTGKQMNDDTHRFYDKAKTSLYAPVATWDQGKSQWNVTQKGWLDHRETLWAAVSTWDQGKAQWKTTEEGWDKATKGLALGASVDVKFGNKLDLKDAIKPYSKTISIKPSFRDSTGSASDKAILNVFGLKKIPTFKLAAKGGIVDAATLFGGNVIAGEAGTEAIIPLDRNTEWMDKVASRMSETDSNEDVYASMYAALTDWYQANMRSTMSQIADDTRRGADNGGGVTMSGNDITSALARKNLRDGRTVIPIG